MRLPLEDKKNLKIFTEAKTFIACMVIAGIVTPKFAYKLRNTKIYLNGDDLVDNNLYYGDGEVIKEFDPKNGNFIKRHKELKTLLEWPEEKK